MSFDATLALIARIEGWLTDAQARRLWDAASSVSAPGTIAEIGSYRGRSTVMLARAAAPGVKLVAIDPHRGGDRGPQQIVPVLERGEEDFAAFHASLERAGVADRIAHVRLPSSQALASLSCELDLLYVDGAHRFRPARGDIEQWGARVKPGGTMLIHDAFTSIGVMLAQLRVLLISREWSYRGRCGSLAEYRRVRLGWIAATLNALRQLAELPYFARNVLIKILLLARLRPLTRLLGHRSGEWPY